MGRHRVDRHAHVSAKVLGALITSAVVPPVGDLALSLHVFGAFCSGATGSLDRCACMRDLVATYVFDRPIAKVGQDILHEAARLERLEPRRFPGPPDL